MSKVSKSPTLKVRSLIDGMSQEWTPVADPAQVKDRFDAVDTIVVVEGRIVSTYEELTKLIEQGQSQGKEVLEMLLVPVMEGG